MTISNEKLQGIRDRYLTWSSADVSLMASELLQAREEKQQLINDRNEAWFKLEEARELIKDLEKLNDQQLITNAGLFRKVAELEPLEQELYFCRENEARVTDKVAELSSYRDTLEREIQVMGSKTAELEKAVEQLKGEEREKLLDALLTEPKE